MFHNVACVRFCLCARHPMHSSAQTTKKPTANDVRAIVQRWRLVIAADRHAVEYRGAVQWINVSIVPGYYCFFVSCCWMHFHLVEWGWSGTTCLSWRIAVFINLISCSNIDRLCQDTCSKTTDSTYLLIDMVCIVFFCVHATHTQTQWDNVHGKNKVFHSICIASIDFQANCNSHWMQYNKNAPVC